MLMPRRHRPSPDTRPDWRDPNLPCIRRYRFGNGETKIEIDPDYERRYREMLVNTPDPTHPDYRSDPTYHLSKRKQSR